MATRPTSILSARRSRPPRSRTAPARIASVLATDRHPQGRSGRVADRELAGSPAHLVGRASAAGAIAVPINTAYKGEFLRHQLADSGSKVFARAGRLRRPGRAIARRPAELELEHVVRRSATARSRSCPRPRRPSRGTTSARLERPRPGSTVAAGRPRAPSSTPAARPGRRRAACSATTTSRRSPSQIGICWERTADDVVWTPLPLFHFNAIVDRRRSARSSSAGAARSTGSSRCRTSGPRSTAPARRSRRPSARWRTSSPTTSTGPRCRSPARPRRTRRCACWARRRCRPTSTSIIEGAVRRSTRSAAPTASTEAALVSWLPPGVTNKPNAAGVINDEYFDVRIFDDDDNEVPRGEDGEIVVRPEAAEPDVRGLLGPARGDRRGEPQLVVPHRRHRPARRRRLPLLRRPQERLPPPPRREHLELRDRARS